MLREHDLLAEFGWVIQEAVTYLRAAFFKLMISRSTVILINQNFGGSCHEVGLSAANHSCLASPDFVPSVAALSWSRGVDLMYYISTSNHLL